MRLLREKGEQPCPYCAVEAAILHNEANHADEHGMVQEDTPLFPRADGGICSKQGIVEALEQLCVRTNQPVLTDAGDPLMGGHSFRVAGARWLAALGIEIAIIMLLARWESAIVLRYIHEAPLRHLTEAYKAAQAKATVPEMIQRLVDDVGLLTEGVMTQGNPIEDVKAEIDEIRARNNNVMDMPEFVRNMRTKMYHRTANASYTVVQTEWRTGCSWRFAFSPHKFMTEIPEDTLFNQVCENCAPDIRRQLQAADW